MPARTHLGTIPGLAALISLAACAGAPARALNPAISPQDAHPPAAVASANAPDEAPSPAGEPVVLDDVAIAVQEATDAYLAGEEAYRSGDLETARQSFDEAVLRLMRPDLNILDEPRLQEAFSWIVADIESLDIEAYSETGEGEARPGLTPPERLKNITEFLTPEELADEMAKVEPPQDTDAFSIPVVLNERVLTMMDAFQRRFSDAFEGGYRRMGRYEPMIRRVLREEGLPQDLIYLSFIESTFKPNAYSRARAKGIWQFMAPTGARYGLIRNAFVDERSDPEKATRAAARYLKDLYEMFDDWYLAMAAYNAGEGKVLRAIERSGTRDFWKLARTRHLRRETKNFVPSILAVSIMSRNPEKYGFRRLEKDPPLQFDKVRLDGPAELSLVAKLAGTNVSEIRELNPQLTRSLTPPGYKSYEVRIPHGRGDSFQTAYAAMPDSEKIAKAETTYRVRRGDTLTRIARRFGTTVSALAQANGISRRKTLSVGERLLVPNAGVDVTYGSGRRSAHVAAADGRYVVRRGDNLWSIARRHRTSIDRLAALNGISRNSLLRPGQVLVVRRPPAGSTAASSDLGTYRVRRGDTLSKIAQRHGMSLGSLLDLNGLSKRSIIHPGQALRVHVPGSRVAETAGSSGRKIQYVVRRGDSLYHIALRHGTSVDRIRSWNRIRSGNVIHPGDVLTIYVR